MLLLMSHFPRLCVTFISAENFKAVLANMDVILGGRGREYYGSPVTHTHTQFF